MNADGWSELDMDEALKPVEFELPELKEFEWPDINLEVGDNG